MKNNRQGRNGQGNYSRENHRDFQGRFTSNRNGGWSGRYPADESSDSYYRNRQDHSNYADQSYRQSDDHFDRGFRGYGSRNDRGSFRNDSNENENYGYGTGYSGRDSYQEGNRFNDKYSDRERYSENDYANDQGRDFNRSSDDDSYEGSDFYQRENRSDSRQQSNRGKGPKGYQRSDDRIKEDVSQKLADDHQLDASNIEVSVESGEVTLSGTIASKEDKKHAEHLIDSLSGVVNVENRLRVKASSDTSGSSETHSFDRSNEKEREKSNKHKNGVTA